MIVIVIVNDFTDTPGARTYEDGAYSGQEFFDKFLKPKFIEAEGSGVKLRIDLDGTNGYASSFINEAFSLLGNEFGADNVWNTLDLKSEEVPKYITKVKESVYEKRN